MEFIWNIIKVISTVTRSTGKTVNNLTVFRFKTTTSSATLSRVFIITVGSTAYIISESPRTTIILFSWIWRLFSVLIVVRISRSGRSLSIISFLGSSWFFFILIITRSRFNTTPITIFYTPLTKIIFISRFNSTRTTWITWKRPTCISFASTYNTTPFKLFEFKIFKFFIFNYIFIYIYILFYIIVQ